MNDTNPQENTQHRGIRSFVRRAGRMSPGQQRALEKLWVEYGVDLDDLEAASYDADTRPIQGHNNIDLNELFNRNAPNVLEIGFGMGHSLLEQAVHNPHVNYLGIEVHQPGVGSLLAALAKQHITNVRIISADAVTVLQRVISDNSFDKVQIFFPDPWPKGRHQKRRLIQVPFVRLLMSKIKAGGYLHLATDWEDYALQMLAVLNEISNLENVVKNDFSLNQPLENRPLTKFEMRGKKLGHDVWDLLFVKM